MSLTNIYLQETPLTSTKNKYIEENYLIGKLDMFLSMKRSKRKASFSQLHDVSKKRRTLISTENKFLHEACLQMKKKKYKCKQAVEYENQHLLLPASISMDDMQEDESSAFHSCPPPIHHTNVSNDAADTSQNLRFTFGCAPAFSGAQGGFCFGSASPFKAQSSINGKISSVGLRSLTLPTAPMFHASKENLSLAAPTSLFAGAPQSLFLDPRNVPETVIYEMPSYTLETLQVQEESEIEIFSSSSVNLGYFHEKSAYNIKSKKLKLLNIVSMALIYSSNLKDNDDMYRIKLQKAADDVRLVDPEFILKLALYARQELHIRAVTNFLLSYAAIHNNTRMFLEKYFNEAVVLPMDWIEVAEYFQVLNGESKRKTLPAALRRAMKKAFAKFDEYQLAKYNRGKSKKKNLENKILEDNEDSEDHVSGMQSFTLKQLIRILHIGSPAEYIMCLLGKKYPENHKSFQSCGLPGSWDPAKAGKRMKLPIPETWETQISLKGNKPNVWESLIDKGKLPYMAMLRNLKNLILSGISPAHHRKVISQLENKKHVINSSQLPLQFFEAYKAVSSLRNMIESNKNVDTLVSASHQTPSWKKARIRETYERMKNVSVAVIEQYLSAISKALEISSLNNLNPIPGKTLIIIEVGHSNEIVKNKKVYETCIMMGLMCLKACEDCKINVLSNTDCSSEIVMWDNDNFLDTLNFTCNMYKQKKKNLTESDLLEACNKNISALNGILDHYLKPQTILSLKLGHIVFMRCSSDSENYTLENTMKSFLHKYRQIVNSDLLYTNVNFSLSNKSFSKNSSEKDMYLCGSSSSLIKLIADRSSGGQLTCVESIDVKYNLPELKSAIEVTNNLSEAATAVPLSYRIPKWHTVRIFISSTFKDMLSERDLLIRYVFPELKKRAASVFVRIVEIDLRWGLTEADSSTKKAAEVCLLEAQKSDLFVGILGDRYGTIYDFDPPDATELEWFNNCPPGLSVTELEIYAAALRNPELSQKKAFFYFRDNSFLRHVPQKWVSHFACEDANANTMVEKLKNKIKSNNFKVLDGYSCHFAGVFENKPILDGLYVLGSTVLEDLWKAVQEIHTIDPYFDEVHEEEMYHQNIIDSHSFFVGKKNSCIDTVLKSIKINSGTFVISGCAGSGKTAVMVNLLQNFKNYVVVKFFVGISPRSQNLSYMLQYICNCFICQLPVSFALPEYPDDIVNQFPDILNEAANCTGGSQLILLIDGLDHLELNDQRLDWLPLILPNRVKLICSASDSSLAFKVLSERLARGNPIFIEFVSPLQQSDRAQFIRNYLRQYGKILDESSFHNEILKVLTKKESSNPFYLRTACDFLRIYATFDNLVPMLQKLPSTVILALQEVIIQLENEFHSLVQTALSLLCITKEGLEDNDIHYILSFLSSVKDSTPLTFKELKEKIMVLKPEEALSQIKYCSLMHIISSFAYGETRQKSFGLRGTEFEKSVQKFYMNKNYASHCKYLHSVLSAYYHHICDPNNDGKYIGRSAFSIRSLLYHMLNGSLYQELSDLLCNFKFIEAVFREKADDQLMECYSSLLYDILPTNQKISREVNLAYLYSFYDFVSRNFHIFHRHPCLVMQQALNEPTDSLISLKNERSSYYSLENLSRSLMLDHRLATISGFVKNIISLTSEKQKPFVLLGSEDGYLKVVDLNARKIVRNIKSHVSAITCICFAGKNRVCASSNDGTLTLWDSTDFSQVAVLKGHRHNVTSCCSDPSGCILFSSGWDNTVRLWSLSDGKSISLIDSFRCPVNCIDHHPLKLQIACGLWNGTIEIWDTVSMERKLTISNSFGSVKSLAYTTDGINIISSFIQSEICIWSSEEGLKMSSLKGHILPVTAISYSLAESLFVSGSDDCTIKVWSSVAEPYFCIITECKFCTVSLMEFMSENLLAVAFQNSDIWIFDVNNGSPTAKFILESDIVSSFGTYSGENLENKNAENNWFETSLVFGTNSGQLMVGDVLTSSTSTVAKLASKITAVIHNNSIILCGSAAGDIGIFSCPDNKLCKIIYAAHRAFITSFSLFHSASCLFAVSTANDNVLKLWEVDMKKLNVTLLKEFLSKHRDCITCSTFHPSYYYGGASCDYIDGLLTGSYDNNVIWMSYDSRVFKGLQSAVLKVHCCEASVLGCGNDGSLVLWNMDGKILTSVPGIELSSTLISFYVTKKESKELAVTFAFVDRDGSIKVKKPFERTFSCSLEGHRKAVTSCCIAGSGEVVSCSLDGSVNLWKLPTDILDKPLMHTSPITGLILSATFAVSSDVHGNLVAWKIDWSEESPLVYAVKKNYAEGFIRKLSWMKSNCFACAVTQVFCSEEKYFLDILRFEQNSSSSLKVKNSYHFENEILCVDTCSITETIVVGFKSGEIMVIHTDAKKLIKVYDDWILGISLCSRENPADLFCASFVDGNLKLYSISNFVNAKVKSEVTPFATYKPSSNCSSKLMSALCCGINKIVCCGDVHGVLRIYSGHSLKFSQRVHMDSITGICIVRSYLFTSSLDRTVKGWNINSLKQVCQFHLHVPITCLVGPKVVADAPDPVPFLLLLGTTSGDVHLLQFHEK